MRFAACLVLLAVCAVRGADVRDCVCDLTSPETAQIRACSLCLEAAKHPASEHVILLKDNDPTKPNRWLVIPRAPYDGSDPLARMTEAERLALWNAAIDKGAQLWGTAWGVAMNGDIARRQCHAHIHVGKLLEAKLLESKEADNGFYVESAAQLPVITDGTGLWFHPVGGRLHVHIGEQVTEIVLMR
jgi:diadenosine tetraphosphate (Ap4A) HIT family hydrolase